MRNAVIAAVAVAALAAVSFLVIGTAKGPSHPPPPDPAPAAPAPAAEPAPAPQVSAPVPVPPAGETAPAVSAAPAPEAPPPAEPSADEQAAPADARPWESIPPLPRGWPALMAKIGQLEPRSDECRPQLARARVRRPNARGAQAGAEPGPSTVLLLELETREGEVRVMGAPVEKRGAAPDAVVSCVQTTLVGQAIPLPGTRPGQRMRLRFPVR